MVHTGSGQLRRVAIAIAVALVILVLRGGGWHPSLAQATGATPPYGLPPLQAHPLPSTLAQWPLDPGQGDYFSEIQTTPAGYLVWSQFPVSVYVEPPLADSDPAPPRSQRWYDAVVAAVHEWSVYLPLMQVNDPDRADIVLWRRSPPLQVTGSQSRAQTAFTRYEFYLQPGDDLPVLAHRFAIWLRPDQTVLYTQATARHELGHALGIWGHSPVETDALYASQVRSPAAISPRDINTLRRIYGQPTRLGWPVSEPAAASSGE